MDSGIKMLFSVNCNEFGTFYVDKIGQLVKERKIAAEDKLIDRFANQFIWNQ